MSSSVKRLPEGGPRRLYALCRAAWSRNSAGTVGNVAGFNVKGEGEVHTERGRQKRSVFWGCGAGRNGGDGQPDT